MCAVFLDPSLFLPVMILAANGGPLPLVAIEAIEAGMATEDLAAMTAALTADFWTFAAFAFDVTGAKAESFFRFRPPPAFFSFTGLTTIGAGAAVK